MVYVAYVIAAVWGCGMLFLAGRLLNSLRLTTNNLAPGANYWGPKYEGFRKGYLSSRIDPSLFNQVGQKHLKELGHNGTLFNIWLIVGSVLVVSFSIYFTS